MPPRGSDQYLQAMRLLRNVDVDPNIIERELDRRERFGTVQRKMLKDQGDDAAASERRQGQIVAEGVAGMLPAYRKGVDWRRESKAKDLDLRKAEEEYEYLSELYDAEQAGGAGGQVSSPGAVGASSSPAPVARAQLAEEERPPSPGAKKGPDGRWVQITPDLNMSPGTAAVLDGRAEPGMNPGLRKFVGPPREFAGPGPNPWSPEKAAPVRGPNDVPSDALIASQAPKTEQAPSTPAQKAKAKKRWQRMIDLRMMKAEEEVNNLRKGRTGNERVTVWRDTGEVDEQGRPIKFNQITGEFAVDSSGIKVRGKEAPSGGADWVDTADVDSQGRPVMFNRKTGEYKSGNVKLQQKPKPGASVASQRPVKVDYVDENGNPVQEFVVPKPGMKFTGKPKPPAADKPLTESERNATMFYNNAENALKNLEAQENKGYRPNAKTALKGMLPNSVQGYVMDADEQTYRQAAEDFTAAKLRLESGASIPISEIQQQAKIYMIMPGDTPEVIRNKQIARRKALQGLKFKSGRGASELAKEPAVNSSGTKKPEDMTIEELEKELNQ